MAVTSRTLAGLLIAAVALIVASPALAQGPAVSPASSTGRIEQRSPLPSKYLDSASPKLSIWTPPGYPDGDTRYGVIYMLDGQNLFDPKLSGYGKVWHADTAAARLMAKGRIGPVIIVGIWSDGPGRYRTYFPKTLYTAARGKLRAEIERLAHGPIASDIFLNYLTRELKPWVDAHYATNPDRQHTTIIGSSSGAMIALEALATKPRVFGQAAAVSMHWPLGAPGKVDPQDPQIKSIWANYFKRTMGRPHGRKLWLDRGTATLDAYYAPYLEREAKTLEAVGWTRGKDFQAETYDGAEHDENYWAARLPEILTWLIGTGDD